jgi:hypothetical protein
MTAPATFSDSDLRAIKRTFYTRKATPEEVCLLLRPRKRSWHTVLTGLPFTAFLAISIGIGIGMKAFEPDEQFGEILRAEFWGVCLFAFFSVLLIFVLLPDAYLPRFGLVLRPGDKEILMRGFGFEQRRPGGCCSVANRHLWCNFYVDSVRYALVRRWWQFPLPIGRGAAAINRVLEPARNALRDLVASGDGHAEMLRSTDRTLWAMAFGEAFVTENEVVLMLLPPKWYIWLGTLPAALGAGMLTFWYGFNWPISGYYNAAKEVVRTISWVPMWLPSAILILYVGLVSVWSDPWFRRALAILPKGKEVIQIRVGKRTLGEFPFGEYTIYVSDGRGLEYVSSYLWVDTLAWTGTKGAEGRMTEFQTAVMRLRVWTGLISDEEESRG